MRGTPSFAPRDYRRGAGRPARAPGASAAGGRRTNRRASAAAARAGGSPCPRRARRAAGAPRSARRPAAAAGANPRRHPASRAHARARRRCARAPPSWRAGGRGSTVADRRRPGARRSRRGARRSRAAAARIAALSASRRGARRRASGMTGTRSGMVKVRSVAPLVADGRHHLLEVGGDRREVEAAATPCRWCRRRGSRDRGAGRARVRAAGRGSRASSCRARRDSRRGARPDRPGARAICSASRFAQPRKAAVARRIVEPLGRAVADRHIAFEAASRRAALEGASPARVGGHQAAAARALPRQASATASATWMPSTAAERMPPA